MAQGIPLPPHSSPPKGGKAQDRQALEALIDAYEEALVQQGTADLAAFLPSKGTPHRLVLLSELIRIEMEHHWAKQRPCRLEDYRERFPEIFSDPVCLREVAFEEYRLRRQAGESVVVADYRERFGIDTEGWQILGSRTRPPRVGSASLSTALPLTDTLPTIGAIFAGFRLLGELGAGTFGKVYLAEQPDLARRLVALKVTSGPTSTESQTLARMQHTNIVPVHSVHRAGNLTAVCMPFFGATTLAHVLRHLHTLEGRPDSGKSLVDTLREARAVTHPQQEPARTPEPLLLPPSETPTLPRQILRRLSYVDAVLWVGARLADGLAHAHERGILHRDLKPANILLADDGQPMLLDFNLSADLARHGVDSRVGGTLPYMAPEHLEAFQGGKRPVDARSDLFSLGVILYELLTGCSPFPVRTGTTASTLSALVTDRVAGAPSLRPFHPGITPAVEAIVLRCLHPIPERRYPNAWALHEDLERQLSHRPLKHTPEPSRWERFQKFHRRHPRLLAGLTALVLLGLVGGALVRESLLRHRLSRATEARRERDEARASLDQLHSGVRTVQYLLNTRATDPKRHREGTTLAERLATPYSVREDAWDNTPLVASLNEAERALLREDLGEIHYLLGRRHKIEAERTNDPERRRQAAEEGWRHCETALACLDRAGRSPALWSVRADLAGLLGDLQEEQQARIRAKEAVVSARDAYLLASEHTANGRPTEAIPLLRRATQQDPTLFRAWFLLGYCYQEMGRFLEASGCYSTCLALEPSAKEASFNRGLTHLSRQLYVEAEADFDAVLCLDPRASEAHANRALALEGQKRLPEALEAVTMALEAGAPETRLYFLRARIHAAAGNAAKAEADRAEGRRREPNEEASWIARGIDRAAQDPQGALDDFAQALRLNPRSVDALRNRAWVLDEKLGRTKESIQALNEAARLAPDLAPVLAGRGVLLARLGLRPEAHRDAEAALKADRSPAIVYQVAGIFAQTTRFEPNDRYRALRLLAEALRQDYGRQWLAIDQDLDPIRKDPEFQDLVR